jgi:hypothetical protein
MDLRDARKRARKDGWDQGHHGSSTNRLQARDRPWLLTRPGGFCWHNRGP